MMTTASSLMLISSVGFEWVQTTMFLKTDRLISLSSLIIIPMMSLTQYFLWISFFVVRTGSKSFSCIFSLPRLLCPRVHTLLAKLLGLFSTLDVNFIAENIRSALPICNTSVEQERLLVTKSYPDFFFLVKLLNDFSPELRPGSLHDYPQSFKRITVFFVCFQSIK